MITIVWGAGKGRYPDGNSLLVEGRSETVLIDPSLTVAADPPAHVDRVLISHCHEDHLAGLHRYPGRPVHAPRADRPGLESLDDLMAMYGLGPEIDAAWRHEVLTTLHYVPRPDAAAYDDGTVFDLGGTTIRSVHLPGHTRGHSGFFIEPDGVMFLADIDLTRFGPYYGDASSSVDDFEQAIRRCREIEAAQYLTFHHKGLVTSRGEFLALLDAYEAVIGRREQAMLDYLAEPHTLEEMVAHRFVYRPHIQLLFADAVERRSAQLHVARLLARGAVAEVEPGRFRALSSSS